MNDDVAYLLLTICSMAGAWWLRDGFEEEDWITESMGATVIVLCAKAWVLMVTS